jgi:hypothetical protein
MTEIKDFELVFNNIADCLMNKYVLTVNQKYKYRIAEIEFYFNDSNMHHDTFCHNDNLQRENGVWYFHRYGGNSYKSGTYKGLDIAFGKGENAHGGILLRSLISLSPPPVNEFIEGPCNLVNKILKLNSDEGKDITEVRDFVSLKDFSLDVFDKKSRLNLSKLSDEDNEGLSKLVDIRKMVRCPRVGLTLKKHD